MLWCWSPTSSWLGLAWSPAPSWGPSSQAALGVLPSVAASCLTCLSRLCGASWQTFWLRCHCPFAWFAPHPVIGLALEYRDVPPDRPSLHHHPLFFLRPLQASAINHYNAPSWRINQKDMLKKNSKGQKSSYVAEDKEQRLLLKDLRCSMSSQSWLFKREMGLQWLQTRTPNCTQALFHTWPEYLSSHPGTDSGLVWRSSSYHVKEFLPWSDCAIPYTKLFTKW